MEEIQFTRLAEFPDYEISRSGIIRRADTHQLVNPSVGIPPRVTLNLGKRIYAKPLIHQLVARTFIPNPQGWRYVRYRDDDPTNYAATNLDWSRGPPRRGQCAYLVPNNSVLLTEIDGYIFDRFPYRVTPDGIIWSPRERRTIPPRADGTVLLRCNPGHTIRKFNAGKIIATVFCARPGIGAHGWTFHRIDGNPLNNHYTNLRWIEN